MHETPTEDQELALASAAERLHAEFGSAFAHETIDELLQSSYSALATDAKRWRSSPCSPSASLASDSKPSRVWTQAEARRANGLFLCVHNAGRSQMALGWFKHLADGRAIAWSGGSEPGSEVNPAAIAAMAEVGIDITQEYPKPWTDEIVQAADVVVTMGCGDACPLSRASGTRTGSSRIRPGRTSRRSGPIRDEIERRVQELLGSLDVNVT